MHLDSERIPSEMKIPKYETSKGDTATSKHVSSMFWMGIVEQGHTTYGNMQLDAWAFQQRCKRRMQLKIWRSDKEQYGIKSRRFYRCYELNTREWTNHVWTCGYLAVHRSSSLFIAVPRTDWNDIPETRESPFTCDGEGWLWIVCTRR